MACENPRLVPNPYYKGMSDDEKYSSFSDRFEDIKVDWRKKDFFRPFDEYVEVPCGICASCQRRRLNGYRIRLLNELSCWQRNAFVTLTFNDKYLEYLDDKCESNYNKPVLQFLDNLRKKYGKGIRHWFVCEFGSLHGRPHYHGILFNLPLHITADDIIDTWNRHRQGSRKRKKSQWSFAPSDRGLAYIGHKCDDQTAHYITKYLTKEWSYDRVVPRIISSKGLGLSYITPEQVAAHHRDGELHPYITTSNDHVVPLPRYYMDRIFTKDEKKQMSAALAMSPFYIFNGKRFPDKDSLVAYRRNVFMRNVRDGLSLEFNKNVKPRRRGEKEAYRLLLFNNVKTDF